MDTLTTIEAVGTDNKDKPVEDIKIERVAVFVDPFQEAEDQLKEMRDKEIEKVIDPHPFHFQPFISHVKSRIINICFKSFAHFISKILFFLKFSRNLIYYPIRSQMLIDCY